ncbi:peroxidase P7-like isoform X2 [Musa acuminata AAA Group]|uniref:peroxidase P7-like isoform X2 n=1 Tax=Musa acuminata AAA Group TaxID=214697 RepID=UPI0031DE4BDF
MAAAFCRDRVLVFCFLALLACAADGQLSPTFYSSTCPNLQSIVRSAMTQAVNKEGRMAASILRLFFHDCFVSGCDGSILLDDTSTFTGEKNAGPNANSVRGFEVIDTIKSNVETACKATVSCADILALAARDGVVLLGGPTWTVQLGRRDATTASQSSANSNLPSPGSSLSQLISSFSSKGLSARDMTALSGAHTIGQARCTTFRSHIYNDANVDASFASTHKHTCPASGGDSNLAPLDLKTPTTFDNRYYQNLVVRRGLLHSDQELFNKGSQDSLVRQYSTNAAAFSCDFAAAMVKMGNISPLTGTKGEIRLNCRKNLNARDLTALSGAHTIGQARCVNFRSHIYNDANIDASFASQTQQNCPSSGGDNTLAPLDLQTPTAFDNAYYQNLVAQKGLLHSDQELFNNGTQDALVRQYSTNAAAFSRDFAAAMVKMGNISPLTGSQGEIRLDCKKVN